MQAAILDAEIGDAVLVMMKLAWAIWINLAAFGKTDDVLKECFGLLHPQSRQVDVMQHPGHRGLQPNPKR